MIRHAELADLDRISRIYAVARETMRQNGNGTQWGERYPARSLLESDIERGNLYVLEEEGAVYGVFALIFGDDPVYRRLEGGAWLNDEPYGAIHRVAGDGRVGGVFETCLAYCKKQADNLRIDTHENNKIMRRLIERSGFSRCGIVHMADGSPRIAYQYCKVAPADVSPE